jgi:hypothetical protein
VYRLPAEALPGQDFHPPIYQAPNWRTPKYDILRLLLHRSRIRISPIYRTFLGFYNVTEAGIISAFVSYLQDEVRYDFYHQSIV